MNGIYSVLKVINPWRSRISRKDGALQLINTIPIDPSEKLSNNFNYQTDRGSLISIEDQISHPMERMLV